MSELNIKTLVNTVLDCMELQMRSSKDWHLGDPAYENDDIPAVEGHMGLRELVMRQHWTWFRLYHLREEGGSPTRVEILETKMERVTNAVNAHMVALLGDLGHDGRELEFGPMMAKMSELTLQAHHRKEEADDASHEAAHHPDDMGVVRRAEDLLERVGEMNTLRIVQGREMIDAILSCSGNGSE